MSKPTIKIQDDGSIEIKGDFILLDDDGNTYKHRDRIKLCRCGQSRTKPYCDNSHVVSNFESKFRTK